MIRAHNIAGIEARGGGTCGNDEFEICRCTECNYFFLYNNETLHVYVDPKDLSKCGLDGVDRMVCPQCDQPLTFASANDEDYDRIRQGRWGWALA